MRVVVFEPQTGRSEIDAVLTEDAEVEIVGRGADGHEALAAIQSLRPDLAILGAALPGRSGFEVIDALDPRQRPAVIFLAESPREAIRAFDAGAADFLLRPVTEARFQAALDRAKRWVRAGELSDLETRLWRALVHFQSAGGAGQQSTAWPARLSLKVEGDYHLVNVRDIAWVEAQRDFVKVSVSGKLHLVRESLRQFEQRLDPATFLRIHRSFLVNVNHVVKVSMGRSGESTLWMTDGAKVPASRASRAHLAALTGREAEPVLAFARAFELKPADHGPKPAP